MQMAASKMTFQQAGKFAACIAASISVAPVQAVAATSSYSVTKSDYAGMRQAAVWMAVRRKLAEWRRLLENWDGDGASAPLPQVIAAAAEFAVTMERRGIPMPHCTLATDGEISFEWIKETSFASASFTDDGHFIAFVRESGRDDALRLDQPYDAQSVRTFLARIDTFA